MISAVAQKYEIHPQTLRLYEREGLLKPSRTEGNTRLYTDDDLERMGPDAPSLTLKRAPVPKEEKPVAGKETTVLKEVQHARPVTSGHPESESQPEKVATPESSPTASSGLTDAEKAQIERAEAEEAIRSLAQDDAEDAFKQLLALDNITVEELRITLLAFAIKMPRDFKGLESLTDDVIRKIMQDNAAKLYKIEV